MAYQQPLSGDQEEVAPNRPDALDGTEPIIKPPPGRIPTSTPPTAPTSPQPQQPQLTDAPQPAEQDVPGNPFAPNATPPAQEDVPGNPFAPDAKVVPPPPPPDRAPMDNYVKANVQAHFANQQESAPGQQTELHPNGFMHDFFGALFGPGWQNSVSGLALRQSAPDTILPEHADLAMRIGSQIGQLAGDLPAMVGGMIAGGAAGSVEAPVVGTISGGSVGAFAAPAAIRKMLMDYYERNPNPDKRDFVASLMAATWEGVKGGAVGAASSITGGLVTPVAGKLVGMGAELAAMTTTGAALEGHLPNPQDFVDGAILMGGLHGISHFVTPESKLQNITAKTGEVPADVISAAAKDIILKQDVIAGNAQEPEQAIPTKLVHEVAKEAPEDVTEGKKPEIIGTNTELVPKNAEEFGAGPEKPPETPDRINTAEASIFSKLGESEEAPQKTFGEKFDDWYAKTIDYLDPIHSAIQEAKVAGAKIATSAYDLGRLFAAHMDKTRGFLEKGTRDGITNEINGEGLNSILRDVPNGDLDGYRVYAMAKRALELDGRGITPWDNFNKDEAAVVVRAGADKFESINQRRIDFSNRVLDYAQQKGLFSADQVAAMKEANKNYVPFNRAFEADDITGTVKNGAAIKQIFGSDRSIVDPILQTYKNTEMIIKKALINEVRSTFVDNMKEGNLIATGEEGENTADKYLQKVSQAGPLRDTQIAVFRNGEREVYEGTPGVIDSLRRLDGDATAMDLTTKILRGFSNATRLGVVSNPAFGFAHFFRSQIMASVYSKTGMLPFQSLFAVGETMGEGSARWNQFIADGGATGSLFKINANYLEDNKVFEANKDAPFIGKAWNAIKKPFEASESFIKLTDNLSRFGEYTRSLDNGLSRTEAAIRARDVVPDYAKVGLQRSVLRTGVAFIGAHINSLDRMAEAFTEDPKGTTMKMAVLTGMSAALWAVNKDDEAIDAIPDWQKDTYWNINISRFSAGYKGPQDATILRLPKPWAPGILFGTGAEVALDSFFKNGQHPQEFSHFAQNLTKSVVPELVPNMLQPIMDQYSNKQAFSGRPLVPYGKEGLLPEMQYSPYTSETAKTLARMIGYVPLVKDIGPSSDPLASPAVVENYIKTWGGTMGGWALKASDWAGRGFTPSTKAEPWQDTPFLHSFVSRFPSFQDQRIQDFYENKDEADRAYNSMRAAAKLGDYDAVTRIQQTHPDFQVRLDGIGKGISTLRHVYENIQDDPKMPAVQKRQLLDSTLFQIGSMAKEGNKMMSDFKTGLGQTNSVNPQAIAGGQ